MASTQEPSLLPNNIYNIDATDDINVASYKSNSNKRVSVAIFAQFSGYSANIAYTLYSNKISLTSDSTTPGFNPNQSRTTESPIMIFIPFVTSMIILVFGKNIMKKNLSKKSFL